MTDRKTMHIMAAVELELLSPSESHEIATEIAEMLKLELDEVCALRAELTGRPFRVRDWVKDATMLSFEQRHYEDAASLFFLLWLLGVGKQEEQPPKPAV